VRIRRSNTLADDEGTVFVTCVPNSPIQVMGRRDPRTGELCVGEVYVLNNCEPPTASDGHPPRSIRDVSGPRSRFEA